MSSKTQGNLKSNSEQLLSNTLVWLTTSRAFDSHFSQLNKHRSGEIMVIVEAFREGGFFMFVILALGIFTLMTMLERFVVLYGKSRRWPETQQFRKNILGLVTRGDFQAATETARETSSPIGRVVAAGCAVRAQGGGEEEVQARMDERLNKEITNLDKKTGFLAMFGNVATLAGLLGTIVGMIRSFSAVAEANPIDRATELSRGISEAMNCTAFGLIVAIPALVAYAYFQSRTDKLVHDLTNTTTSIFNDLIFKTEVASTSTQNKASYSNQTPTIEV